MFSLHHARNWTTTQCEAQEFIVLMIIIERSAKFPQDSQIGSKMTYSSINPLSILQKYTSSSTWKVSLEFCAN